MVEQKEMELENQAELCPECGDKLQHVPWVYTDPDGNEFCDDGVRCLNGCNLTFSY